MVSVRKLNCVALAVIFGSSMAMASANSASAVTPKPSGPQLGPAIAAKFMPGSVTQLNCRYGKRTASANYTGVKSSDGFKNLDMIKGQKLRYGNWSKMSKADFKSLCRGKKSTESTATVYSAIADTQTRIKGANVLARDVIWSKRLEKSVDGRGRMTSSMSPLKVVFTPWMVVSSTSE